MRSPFVPEDIARFVDLGQLAACGAHDRVACVARTLDLGTDGYMSTIWTFDAASGESRRFTTGEHGDNAPTWSPDGATLAFVSPRTGAPQVHLIAADGGEARALTRLAQGAGSPTWSPDGRQLLVTSAVALDLESREAGREAEAFPPPDAPEVAWRLPYKSDGVGYLLKRAFHLFMVDAQSGNERRLTRGPFDVLSACWSPDGRSVAFTRTRAGREAHRTDLWRLDLDDGRETQLTHDIAAVMSPAWSPDGTRIVFAGGRTEGSAQARLYLADLREGSVRQLAHDDLEVASATVLHWTPDSRALLLVVATHACQHVVRVDATTGDVTPLLTGERHIAELAVSRNHLVYFSESASTPRELCAADLDGRNERRLSFMNAWWDERTEITAEIRRFDVPDGAGGRETIEGWVVRAAGTKGPTKLMIEAHGGPNSFALLGYPWNTYWNVLCSRGWTICVPHAVGSTSFGRRFAERLNGHWGELDFPQFLAVLDALQADGIADDRAVIAGKSYGGYLSAWAIGHTDRFRAAIVAAPVANLESHLGTSDGGYYSQPYTLHGERHIEAERYHELSPVTHIHLCKTPTLFLQGKEDERCPRGQSEELFTAVMRQTTTPAEMVMYPGGDHHLYETGKPSHRLDVVKRMVAWVERWTS